MQPLDLTFFGSLKNALYREYNLYLTSTGHQKITEYDLAAFLNKAFIKVASIEKSISGFRTAGIYPVNPDIFDENDFAPSVTQEALLVETVFANQNSNSIETTENMNNLPTSSHKESETISIAKPSTSKTRNQVQITDVAPIPSKKRRVASRKHSCENIHSEILTASPQRRKLQEKLEKQKKNEEKKKQILKKGEEKKKQSIQTKANTSRFPRKCKTILL